MSFREEQCNKVCRILDDVLANRPTERDSLITAVRIAFSALNCSEIPNSSGSISRQAAIDLVKSFYKIDKSVLKIMVFKLKQLPSAQPEIIRCKDCRYSIDEYGDGECYCKRPSRELVWIGKRWDFFCAAARLKMEVEHE